MTILNKNYREYKLSNGLVVALQRTPTETIVGQLRFHHGGVHENPAEEGIAHFLEHNVINGCSEKYSLEEAKKIKDKFPMSNAYTSNSETAYFAGIFPENLELFLGFSSDITFNPRLDNKVIDIQRQRVLREISDKKGRPDFYDEKMFVDSLYRNRFHPYFVLGETEVITNANQETLQKFHSRGYSPNNADLILVGALPNNIEKIIEKYFSKIPKGLGEKFDFPFVSPLEAKIKFHSLAKDLENKDNLEESNAAVCVGFIVPHLRQQGTYPTALLNSILGGSNSRLHKSISEQKGLAYSISSLYNGVKNSGAIIINGNIHAKKQEEALGGIFEELRKFRDEPIKVEELEAAKNRFRYSLAKEVEKNEGMLGNKIQFKLDYGITTQDYLSNMAKVTPADIQEVAQKYLPKSSEDNNYILLIRDPLKKE